MNPYKTISFIFFLVFISTFSYGLGIVAQDYEYERSFYGTYKVTFDIHLENISNSNKLSNIVKKLIYKDKNFDEYITYTENTFIETPKEEDYPPKNDVEYPYHSELIESYNIIYYNDEFILIKHTKYFYYTMAAHGNYWEEYFVIDINEEKILNMYDLVTQIPEDLLKEKIELNYDIDYFLRENMWPPDTINFQKDGIELLWNTYSITPYVVGVIDIKIEYEIGESFLTKKGKMIKDMMENSFQNLE